MGDEWLGGGGGGIGYDSDSNPIYPHDKDIILSNQNSIYFVKIVFSKPDSARADTFYLHSNFKAYAEVATITEIISEMENILSKLLPCYEIVSELDEVYNKKISNVKNHFSDNTGSGACCKTLIRFVDDGDEELRGSVYQLSDNNQQKLLMLEYCHWKVGYVETYTLTKSPLVVKLSVVKVDKRDGKIRETEATSVCLLHKDIKNPPPTEQELRDKTTGVILLMFIFVIFLIPLLAFLKRG